jgi:formate dehydrogenase major subunit
MISVTIDGTKLQVPQDTTVLQAAEMAIEIPTLCNHPAVTAYGGCRLCLVEVEGARTLQPSCTLPVSNGMVVRTNTPQVGEARRFILGLLFSERNHFCMYCQTSGGDCELQNAAYQEDMTHWPLQPNWQPYAVDGSHKHLVLEPVHSLSALRPSLWGISRQFHPGYEGARFQHLADNGSGCVPG